MFALEFHYKYLTSEIENWIIFERDIKLDMIYDYLQQKKEAESYQE